MAEEDKAAKHRLFFPRPAHWKNETPQHRGPANPSPSHETRPGLCRRCQHSDRRIFQGQENTKSLKDLRVYKHERPVFTRPERPEEPARHERQTQKLRAEAHVAMQFKQQQADQIAEHRRQTSRLREQHRQQFDLIFSREVDPKEDRIQREIKTLHDREKQAVKEFDAKRRSLAGRAARWSRVRSISKRSARY